MSDELYFLTIAEAAKLLKSKALSPVELTQAILSRIDDIDPRLDSYLLVTRDEALHQAQDAEQEIMAGRWRGPLHGIPYGLKDIIETAGIRTTAHSKVLANNIPAEDATVALRLKQAGAILLGKHACYEFANSGPCYDLPWPPARNPWDPAISPGGSSSGSGVAVAAGMAMGAVGSDTAGSIRSPASLCGIVGLKPTYGAVSRYGLIAFASSLDQAGPLTRDVTDAALLFASMVGERDPCDSTSLEYPGTIEAPQREDLRGLRLGVPAELTGEGIEPGVLASFEATLELARSLGAIVEPCALPHAPHALSAYYLIAPAEASSNLARFDGVRYGHRAEGATDLLTMYTRTRHDGFGDEVKRRIMLGTYALSSGYYDAYYGRAQRVRTKIAEDFASVFERFDAIVTPTAPGVAFALGSKTADPLAMYLNDYCTVPMSLAGIPAISIPSGLAAPPEGGRPLPVGFQLAGPPFSENALLAAAYALERAIGFDGSPAAAEDPA